MLIIVRETAGFDARPNATVSFDRHQAKKTKSVFFLISVITTVNAYT
ncbi:MAG: hypothetical protein GY749_44825 [Desulfobacteraceae bacterium]|nr:hypothetical protein [Desulfobacteraceae bacterium]